MDELLKSLKATHLIFSRDEWKQFVWRIRAFVAKIRDQNRELRIENSGLRVEIEGLERAIKRMLKKGYEE